MDLEWRSAIQVTECDNLKFYVILASLKTLFFKKKDFEFKFLLPTKIAMNEK